MSDTITLSVDELIELVRTLQEEGKPPPQTVDRLPQATRDRMSKSSGRELTFDVSYDEDEDWKVTFGLRLPF